MSDGCLIPPDLMRLRVEYSQRALCEDEVDRDPIRQFVGWLDEAISAQIREPNAMTLATCTSDGVPSARIVLLKGVDREGFAFFTNYNSRKGRELDQNPRAALVLFWPELERQIRIEGTISRTTAEESDAYFASRPIDAQVGSAASPQGEVIPSREHLEKLFADLRARYPDGPIPRPPHWGGYRLSPSRVEFWQGRPSRLHDRIEYRLESGQWIVRRLAP